jgi:3-oxo-5-alpha-steroid 4-dehydrogenase 1
MGARASFILVLAGLGVALGVFITLFFVSAPYGRHLRKGWGPQLPNLLGWIFMESPSALIFAVFFILGKAPKNLPLVLFFVLWELHYIHRAFIYPFTIRDRGKKMPVAVMVMGIVFNLGNAYANSYYLFSLSGGYPRSWLLDPRFLAGLVLFLAGYGINRWSDLILRSLRKPGETDYRVPHGGLFRWVSSPNYLGEIIEWCGWALATWSLPGLAFALWTIANLAPRARSNHRWYQAHFPEYPPERKALIPWLW